MKRKYVESTDTTLLFEYFRKRNYSIDLIKYQVYGSNNFIPEDFPSRERIPDLEKIINRLK